jgi:hypothetical protein
MERTIQAIAMELAEAHREDDPSALVYWYPDANEVRLLEVTKNVPDDGDILHPFAFTPDHKNNIPYPSVIVLVNPEQYQRIIKDGGRAPVDGWRHPQAL